MKEFKLNLKHDMAEAFDELIGKAIGNLPVEDDNDRLLVAALHELQIRLKKKLVVYRPQYLTTLTPVQAIGLRLLYTDLMGGASGNVANKLRMLADEIHRQYSNPTIIHHQNLQS